MIFVKTFTDIPFCEKEILRYAGCKTSNNRINELLSDCKKETENIFSYKVCYGEFDVNIKDNTCDFGVFKFNSKNLALNLKNCRTVIIFGATVGIALDRLIQKYSITSPAKAVMLQAIGAERIEALCDKFCEDLSKSRNITFKPRFSAGYGDLPLETQKDIFRILDLERKIGLTLNNSLLMSPTKSVTAFAGII